MYVCKHVVCMYVCTHVCMHCAYTSELDCLDVVITTIIFFVVVTTVEYIMVSY